MKRRDPQSIAQVIDDAFREIGAEDIARQQRLCAAWPEIVGVGISRRTLRRFIDSEKCLHVFLTSAVLKSELAFRKETLIQLLNRASGANDTISDIKFH